MLYLFLGDDRLAKDTRIAEVKHKFLSSKEALSFDSQTLYGVKLSSEELKKALIALPAVSRKRVVVLRDVHKLSPHNKTLILDFIDSDNDRVVLLLDTDEANPKNAFFQKLSSRAKVNRFQKKVRANVFDMTKALSQKNLSEALKILAGLLEAGDHPLQIMGGLVWFWGKNRNRMSREEFKKGLFELQEADLNIKRSRLRPDYTLEVLVTKLSSLTSY